MADVVTGQLVESPLAPCEAGESLCDDLTCSAVDCATRDLMLSDATGDIIPPVITFIRGKQVTLSYGDAPAAAALGPCVANTTAIWGTERVCHAVAVDAEAGDVSSTLEVRQDTSCSACSARGCPLDRAHQCLPDTYGFLFTAVDADFNRASARLLVTVAERGAVEAEIIMSSGTSDAVAASALAAAYEAEGSAENTATRQGIADALSEDGTTADEVAIVAVVMEDATEDAVDGLNLLVKFTVDVELSDSERRRQLLQKRRRLHGLASDVSSQVVTPEVDTVAAYQSQISGAMAILERTGDQMVTDAAAAEALVATANADDADWVKQHLEHWVQWQETDFANIEALGASTEEMLERLQRFMEFSLVQKGLVDAQLVAQNVGRANDEILAEAVERYNATFAKSKELITAAASREHALPAPGPQGQAGDAAASCREEDVESLAELLLAEDRKYSFNVPAPMEAVARRHLMAKAGPATEIESDRSGNGNKYERNNGEVDYNKFARWQLPSNVDVDTLTLTPATDRKRHLVGFKNRLVRGVLFYVSRGAAQECTSRFQHLGAPCYNGHPASERYGSDPIFRPGSTLYRADLADDMDVYYNTSDRSALSTTGIGMPFVPRSLQGFSGGQPYFLDAGIGAHRAQQLYTFLEEGNLIEDAMTSSVESRLFTWNIDSQSWTVVTLKWLRPSRGNFEVVADVLLVPITNWRLRSFSSFGWLLLHVAWGLLSIQIFYTTFEQLDKEALRQR
eukprot:gene11110-13128_t